METPGQHHGPALAPSAIDTHTAEALSYRNRGTLRGGRIMEHETRLSG